MSKRVVIFHNPRCSKSREALDILTKEYGEVEIVEYLKHPPTPKDLKIILSKLNIEAVDLVRKKEKLFLDKYKGKQFSNEEWIQILCENPVLIERPIVIDGYKAVIGRPVELVIDLLNRKKTS